MDAVGGAPAAEADPSVVRGTHHRNALHEESNPYVSSISNSTSGPFALYDAHPMSAMGA
ncbi:hypothetical protein [Streptomyces sp. NPDC002403]